MLSRQIVSIKVLYVVFLLLSAITSVSIADDFNVTYAHSLYSGSESVDFSPDGKYIATGDIDGDVGFWNVGSDESITYVALGGEVRSVAFRFDSQYLAADGNDGDNAQVWLLNVSTRTRVRSRFINNDAGIINAIDYSPDGRYVAVGMDIRWAYIWDISTDALKGWGKLDASEVYDVAFSPDGTYLATGNDAGRLVLRELSSWWGDDVDSISFDVGGDVQAVAFSPDGKYVAADGYNANSDNTYVNIYNMSDFSLAWQVSTDDVHSIAFSPDSQYIAMGDTSGTISFYQIGTTITLVEESNADSTVHDLAWSPDGSLISDGRDVWDVNKPSVPIADATENKIYWMDYTDGELLRSNLDGSNVEVVLSGLGVPVGIALDTVNRKMYWTEERGGKIRRANLNGSGVEDILTGLDRPSWIALDVATGKMYWLEQGSDKIRRANLNGTSVEDLVTTGSEIDGGIALDLTNGKLYWTDWYDDRILRFNLNGTGAEVLLTGLDDPSGFALDVATGKMYWLEQGSDKARRANLNGTGVEDLVTTGIESPYDITLDLTMGKMYWSDWATDKIRRANLDGSNVETLVSGLNHPLGIGLDLSHGIQSNIIVNMGTSPVESHTVGELFTIPLNIRGGENVAGYQATVTYDTTALEYVSSENRDYLPSGAFAIPTSINGNQVTLAATSLSGESMGDGTLATITFEILAVKNSTLRLSDVILTNSMGETTRPQTEILEIIEPIKLPEDVNDDGIVNIIDLTLVASNFGKTGTNVADINNDGVVNIVDLTLVAAAFGNTAAAPVVWGRDSEIAPTRDQVEQWLQEARQLNLTDPDFQRGILVLEQLLASLTPKETALLPNYPNPFNPETWIPYQLATPADVSISIYATDGTLVRMLDLGHQPIGVYHQRSRAAHWNGKNAQGEHVASGVYFYTLSTGQFSATRKMLILK